MAGISREIKLKSSEFQQTVSKEAPAESDGLGIEAKETLRRQATRAAEAERRTAY